MTLKFFIFPLGLLAVILAGCGPQLARTNYGPEEQQWKDYIQKSYNNWEPPPTPAPYSDNQVSYLVTSEVETVPTATPSDGADKAVLVVEEAIIIPEETVAETDTSLVQTDVLEPAPAEIPQTYTVQRGDTLWTIAQKFYGNGNSWRIVRDANKSVLGDSNTLKTGMVLQIPIASK